MTNDPSWDAVDEYFTEALIPADPALDDALAAASAAGLPNIAVSPLQGRFLRLLVAATGARKVLEVGTLGGYSTICLARGVGASGSVLTLEVEPRHAEVARANLDRAEVGDRVEIRVGPAADSLANVPTEDGPYDFVFIDADKRNNPVYLAHALRLSRPGTTIVIDNVVRRALLSDQDADVRGVRTLAEDLKELTAAGRLDATTLQTVGVKGWDGFALAVVR